jgi:glycosyltransferase involved in cell wall biosynthesis
VSGPTLDFIVPGRLEQRTGGYLYDARMVQGLREREWTVRVHELDGAFPSGDEIAAAALDDALAGLDDDALVVVDGLAMGGLPDTVARHGPRLRLLALVHHPLADETGLSEEERDRFKATETAALAAAHGVLVTSPYTARRLQDFDVWAARVRAVPPGTEPATLAHGPGEGEPPRLICVATLTRRKGHDVLVEALDRVRDLPWTCVCAGSDAWDPDHASAVRRQVDTLGLASRVTFEGERDAAGLDALYRSSSAFVLASFYEGYGMALAEALARGLPVVSTTGGAIPFTVPGDAGILVPPGDAGAFAEALRSLLDPEDAEVRERLSAAARRHAERLPDWDAAVDAFAVAVHELSDVEA